jgi:hypothetical protein
MGKTVLPICISISFAPAHVSENLETWVPGAIWKPGSAYFRAEQTQGPSTTLGMTE